MSDNRMSNVETVALCVVTGMATYVTESEGRLASFIAWTEQMPGLFTFQCPVHGRESVFRDGMSAAALRAFVQWWLDNKGPDND